MSRLDLVSTVRSVTAILESASEREALAAAVSAAVAITGARHAGVTLVHGHGRELASVGATDVLAERVGALQHDLLQGPGIDAAFTGCHVASDDVTTDERRPQWTARAGRMGVACVLSVPMHHEHRHIGALHVYGSERGAFIPQERDLLAALAHQTAVVVARLRTERDLDAGLDARTVVGQAQGIGARLGREPRVGHRCSGYLLGAVHRIQLSGGPSC